MLLVNFPLQPYKLIGIQFESQFKADIISHLINNLKYVQQKNVRMTPEDSQ